MARPAAPGAPQGAGVLDRQAAFYERVIRVVTTPLALFCLVILVVDATFFVAAQAADAANKPVLYWGAVAIIVLVVIGVMLLAVFRPDALYGPQPLRQQFAASLARSLFRALEGSLANTKETDQVEGYATLLINIETGLQGEYASILDFRSYLSQGLMAEITQSSRPLGAKVRARQEEARREEIG